jgi:hypothetical protein
MKDADKMLETHWLAVDGLAERFGMSDHVRKSIEQTFERWDGRGVPHGAKGEDILVTSRLVNLPTRSRSFTGRAASMPP